MDGPRETAIVMPALMLPESHTGATAYSTAPMAPSQEQPSQPQNGTPGWTTAERNFGRVFRAMLLAAAIVLLALGGAMDVFVCVFLGIIFLIAALYTIIVPYVSDLWIDPAQQQGNLWRVLLSTIAVLLYIAQAIILDFFINRFQSFHWSWIVFDVLVFIAVLVLAHGITGLRLLGNSTFLSMRQYLAGFCLAVYTALLLGKMCTIALNTPLNVEGFWSHTTFIVVLGACIPIYILLRWTLDRPNASGGGMFSEGPNPWQLCLEHIFLVINLVDTLAVLHFLPRANEPKDQDADRFITLTIVITCISHVTAVAIYYSPVVLYAQLHLKTSTSRLLTFFIRHGQFIMVDGLLLSLRLVVWFWMDWLVTAFIIKNVIFLFLGVSYEKAFRTGNSSNCEKNLRAADLHISQLTAEMQRLRMEMYRQQNVTHLYVTPPTNIVHESPSQFYQVDGNGMVMGPRVTVNPASAAYLHQVPYVVDGSSYGDAIGPSDEHAVPGTPLLIRTMAPANTPPPPGVYPLHHTPNSPKSA